MGLIHFFCCRSDETEQDLHVGRKIGYRHLQMVLYFLLMVYTYCMRTVLSVAIVAMNNSTSSNPHVPVYHWDNQSVVLSAFFWGYAFLQLPAAQLGKKFGVKWLLMGCSLTNAGFCILIPLFAENYGSNGVIIARVIQGLSQGCIPSLLHNLLGHWAPPDERSVMGTFSYSGAILGSIISLSTTGLISSSWIGWPYAFYLFGALGIKWAILWFFLGADKPGQHKSISPSERAYIESSLAYQEHRVIKTPWKCILTSLPFWAITLSFIGANWCTSVMMTEIPTYLDSILNYNIKSGSILSAAPYMVMWICSLIFSPFCDMLINREIVSRGTARKLFSSIGTLIPAVCLGLMGFIPKDRPELSIALLITGLGVSAGGLCGYQVNHLDLSPNHSGILMGLTNGFSSIFSVISPLIVQFIVTDKTNQHMWRTIFIITSSIYIGTNTFYCIFASGEVQSWNYITEEHEESSVLINSTHRDTV